MSDFEVRMYSEDVTTGSVREFMSNVRYHSNKIFGYGISDYNYSTERFADLVLNGKGGFFGVWFDSEGTDGYTFGLSRKEDKFMILLEYSPNNNLPRFLNHVKNIYDVFSPSVGFAYNPEFIEETEVKQGKNLPHYFEWFWILGPELAEQYDLSKIPAAFQIKKLQDGGVIILDPNPLNSKITEQDKRKLYKLPKKRI